MHDPDYKRARHEEAHRIVLIYAIFAGLWIVMSDWALEQLIADTGLLQVAQTLKGWLFVVVTSLLLYFLLNGISRNPSSDTPVRHTGMVNWPRWQLYLFALAMPFISLLIRDSIAVSFEERPLLLLFMLPIILSAALGGLGPGTLSTLLSAVLVAWFVMPPRGSFYIEHSYDLFQIGFLVCNGLLISFLSRMLHDARHRAETEKRRAIDSLSEKTHAMQLLDGIAKSSTDAIFVLDFNGRFILFNPACERTTGKTAAKVLGRDEHAIFPPDIANKVIADNRKVMAENKAITFQDDIVTVDGKRTFLSTKGPLHDDQGKVIGLFGIARDISDIMATKAALRRERDRNQRYLDSAQAFMLALDGEGRISMINRYGCELLGYRESEMIGQNWFRHYLPQPEGMEIISPMFRQIMSGKLEEAEYFENEVLCRDGSRRLIAWHNGHFKNEAGNIVGTLSSGEDITVRKAMEMALRENEERLRLLINHAPAALALFDLDMRYLAVSRRWMADFRLGERDIIGRLHYEVFPEIGEELKAIHQRCMSGETVASDGDSFVRADGSVQWLRWEIRPWYQASGAIGGIVIFSEDITERKQAEEQLRKLSLAVEQSPECILITNLVSEIEYVNEAFVRNTGYSRDEIIGKKPSILQSGKTPKGTYSEMWKHLSEGQTWQGEFHNKRKDGSEYSEHAIVSPIIQPDGRISHYVSVQEDITAKMFADAEINRLAFFDSLTGLPNRALLLERTAQALATMRRVEQYSALLLFNLDRFKTLNDAGGQEFGDKLLQGVGERLTMTLHDGDVVARIAGDEFAILLSDLAPEQQTAANLAMHIAKKIHACLQEPFVLGTERIILHAGLGISLFPGNENDSPLDILRRANTALHHAKSEGSDQTAFFESTLDEIAKHRFDVERELHLAITNGELRVFLQPQVEANGNIVGAEALVRWQHPQRGLIQPSSFIPVAEESNLIIEIGEWVFTEVCRMLSRKDMAAQLIRIAVNISPRHFRQPDFVDWVRQTLTTTGADPAQLTLEVTEGMLINNISDVIAKMEELNAMGFHFSMDDFGTGYSSLSHLKRLPIHELKIDKSFIQDLTLDPEDDALVEAILAVAKLMHVEVVAEGVETKEQAAFLNQRGTVIHQGYLFGRPEPAATVISNILDSKR